MTIAIHLKRNLFFIDVHTRKSIFRAFYDPLFTVITVKTIIKQHTQLTFKLTLRPKTSRPIEVLLSIYKNARIKVEVQFRHCTSGMVKLKFELLIGSITCHAYVFKQDNSCVIILAKIFFEILASLSTVMRCQSRHYVITYSYYGHAPREDHVAVKYFGV